MQNVLNILLFIFIAATVITLVLGMGNLFSQKGKNVDDKSNKLMRWRVIFQGITLLILAILLAMR
ncbi:MAG: twin transmembrane helix small protein [Alphaproteobacteria bacterium]|nr:twin transmembrane helix small protein [Alphaproteobacteria bacterium]